MGSKKKKTVNASIIVFIVGFIAFSIAWIIMWLSFVSFEALNAFSGHRALFPLSSRWASIISELGLFVSVPLAGIFVYLFTNGSKKKALLAMLFGFFIVANSIFEYRLGEVFHLVIEYALSGKAK